VRLPEELDDSEKRIRELKAKVSEYENRMPELSLTFEDGTNRLEARLREMSAGELDAFIEQGLDALSRAYKFEPEPPPSSIAPGSVLAGTHPFLAANVRYNRQLQKYFLAYETYLRERERFRERIVRLKLSLVNTGSCPGESADIILRFPSELPLFHENGLPLPEPPKAPQRWAVDFDRLLRTTHNFQPILHTVWSNVRGPYIEEDKCGVREVRFHVKEAKHGLSVDLDPLFVLFESWNTVRSFRVPYALYAANVPRPVEGELHVSVKIERAP
jgi:hypothetical protein